MESIPCTRSGSGIGYCVENPPLFIKEISVGDVISVSLDKNGDVAAWMHISKSRRSTIWLLRKQKTPQIAAVLRSVREMGCNTVQLAEFGCFSIDVPAELSIDKVDACISLLPSADVAVAHPSFRHEEA